MNETEPKYFTEFKIELNKKLDERFDSQEEQIAHVSEQVTMLAKEMEVVKSDIQIMKGDIVIIKEELHWKQDKKNRPASVLAWL